MKLTVKENDIRRAIRKVLEGAPGGGTFEPKGTISTNSQVDKTAVETDPSNVNYIPQDKTELSAAIKTVMRDVSDTDVPNVYKAIKDATTPAATEKPDHNVHNDDVEGMHMKKSEEEKKEQAESVVRKEVRKQLQEIFPQADYSYQSIDYFGDSDDEEPEEPKKRKNSRMSDVDGATFEEIANELDFAVSGAKQAVEKALKKAQYVALMPKDDLEILTLHAAKDYIDYLQSSSELTQADVQLMYDHPRIVMELEGFRDFLDKYIRRHRKENDPEEEG